MICAIVPAAGASRRMGTQKLLLPYAGTTVIGHVVDQLLAAALDGVYVVVGHDAERVIAELARRAVHVVVNPDRDADMLSSVRCGLRALPPQCTAALVALGDQPSVTAGLVDRIVRAHAATGRRIVVPTHNARRGHPLLFSLAWRDEVLTRFADLGLRGLLRAHGDDILDLPCDSPAVLSDVDTPEDYRRQLESL